MPREFIYECCICHRKLKNVDTCKIVKWMYDQTGRSQFNQRYMKHFCMKCISKIDSWIQKHEEEDINVD